MQAMYREWMCFRCDAENYSTVQKLDIIDRVVTRYGFYNYLGSDPLAGVFGHLFYEHDLFMMGLSQRRKA